jgi:hypothetical protein
MHAALERAGYVHHGTLRAFSCDLAQATGGGRLSALGS